MEILLSHLRDYHVFFQMDNTSAVFFVITRAGCVWALVQVGAADPTLNREQAALTGGSLYSFNLGENILSRQGRRPGEWRLHLEVEELICTRYDRVEVDMFTSAQSTYCPL